MKKNSKKIAYPVILTLMATSVDAFDGIRATANGTVSANAVTVNGDGGIITSPALTTAADTWEAAVTVTNSKVTTSSAVIVSITTQAGTIGTNGVAAAVVTAVGSGSFTLRYGNIGTNALAGAIKVAYHVINPVT